MLDHYSNQQWSTFAQHGQRKNWVVTGFELATPIFAGYELKTPGFQVCQPLDQRTEVLDRSNSWLREVLDRIEQ